MVFSMKHKGGWIHVLVCAVMISATPLAGATISVRVNAALNEQRRIVGDVRFTLEGGGVASIKHVLERNGAAARMSYFEQALRETISDARVVDFDIGSLNESEDGVLRITFSFYSDYAVEEGDAGVALLRMPSLAPWFASLLHGDRDRKSVEGIAQPSFDETVRLDLGRSGFRVRTLPELQSVDLVGGRIEQSLSQENDDVLLAQTVLEHDLSGDAGAMGDAALGIMARERTDRQWIILQREQMLDEERIVVFDEQVLITLLGAGRWREERIREWGIVTPDGIHDNTLLRFAYDPKIVEVRVESVAVRSPGGEIAIFDPDRVSTTVGGAFPWEHIVLIDLPDLEVGSTVRTHLVVTHKKRPFFSTMEGFFGPHPIRRKRVEVRYPEGGVLTHTVSGEGRVLKTRWDEAGETVIEWSAHNLPALPNKPNSPPSWMIAPALFLSQGNADSVVDWIARPLSRAASGTRALRRLAREKSEGANHRNEQVIALRDWVDREIEPIESGRCGLSPDRIRSAGEILEEGAGTQMERMVLLHALLDAMRLSPRMVVASDLPRGLSVSAPPLQSLQWGALGPLLVAIEGEDGETIYLDETGRHAPLGYTAHAGRPAIDLQTGEWIYPRTHFSDQTDTVYRITLAETGDADVEQVVRHFGSPAVRFHRQFEGMTPEGHRQERQRRMRKMGIEHGSEAELQIDLEGSAIEFRMRVPGFAVRDGEWMVMTIPPPPAGFFPAVALPRDIPVYVDDAEVHILVTEVDIPEGWRPVVLPPPLEMILPGRTGQIFVHSVWQAGQVRCIVEVHRLPAKIAPGEYARIMNEMDLLLRSPARAVVLRRTRLTSPEPAQ